MHIRVKGKFGIGGAVIIGIIMILGAFYVKHNNSVQAQGTLVIPMAVRTPLDTKDSNANGIPDWEEDLQANIFETIQIPTTAKATSSEDGTYVPPTTFTGKFSEAFFKDYLQGKVNGKDFSDPTEFIDSAVATVENNTASKRHTRLEITIVPSTPESIRTYGNRIAEITQIHTVESENEALILQKALETSDKSELDKLDPIHTVYANIIADTLKVAVPDTFATQHVELLNAYEAILTDVGAMRIAFSDPLYALARTKQYQEDANNLFNALKSIANTLTENNITYANDEAGAFFYLFDS